MTKMTIAQLEYLSQQLSNELETVKHHTSKAWIEEELVRISTEIATDSRLAYKALIMNIERVLLSEMNME
jgi:hypothetical protein